MSGLVPAALRHRWTTFRPYAILTVIAAVFFLLPTIQSGAEVGTVNVKNVMQSLASLGLVTLALGLTMTAGEFDLSVSSTFLLGGMLAVKTGQHSPLTGVLVAVAVGLAVGVVQGVAIAKLRLNSMSVTLGGFIALLGLVFVISNSNSISYPNLDVGARLDRTIFSVFSIRILLTIGIFFVIAAVFQFTTLGRDVRATGSDRNASRTAGVRVDWILIGVFALSGCLATLGGALQGYSLAYATPDRTVAPLIFATTATLLGGVPLSGGRGTPLGIAAGVLSLSLIVEAIPILHSPEYVNSLVPAAVLMLVTLIDAPDLLRWWKRTRARRGPWRAQPNVVSPEAADG